MSARRRQVSTATSLALAAVLLASCLGGGDEGRGPAADPGRLVASAPADCRVGEAPRYFVPARAPTLVGCARLGVSGKRVDFSVNRETIVGKRQTCINPAYAGPGSFIPAICASTPHEFAVLDASQPSQGVSDYAYVIWGTTGDAGEVVARYDGGSAKAVVFEVRRDLAAELGEDPFRLFVLELPLAAGCGRVTISAGAAADRVAARPRVCTPPPVHDTSKRI
jgi:hypothetical protein